MKIVEVNSMPNGSTGKIMFSIGEYLQKTGNDVFYAFPEFDAKCPEEYKKKTLIIGNKYISIIAHILGRLSGYNDCFNYYSTKRFLNKLERLEPDILHIHNLHNCYIDYKLLFEFITRKHIKVIWTLHDCWSFTGGCVHFSMLNCLKWQKECNHCKLKLKYPVSYSDKSKYLFNRKKNSFTSCEEIIFVSPSQWLNDLVHQSFLQEYKIKNIYNGIDLEIFKADIARKKKRNKTRLLGVAFKWNDRKGLNIFIQLAEVLDDEKYEILLVGIDEKTRDKLPSNIIQVPPIANQKKLAEYYKDADIFINPTLEDNFPTTNLEAIACGTPVITYNSGGSAETIRGGAGIAVEKEKFYLLLDAINEVCNNLDLYRKKCLEVRNEYDCKKMSQEYEKLLREEKYI